MTGEITAQQCAEKWAASLAQRWIEKEEPSLYYIDGHVKVYHGYLARLGRKHVSRQRLCLPGVMEFWVNASDGSPYFYITADVNEKMNEMLKDEIIPELLTLHPVSDEHRQRMEENEKEPLFTLVFDREAYSPEFFIHLWDKYRIAVITYRKNVKVKWDESLFEEYTVSTTFGAETMKLHEQNFYSGKNDKYCLREIRRLCTDGHQTSIVSTNQILIIEEIASYMFARWSQEIFFRYMRQEYALDKIIQYSVDELEHDIKVVNVEYNNLSYRIKKEREKLKRRKADLYGPEQKNPLQQDDEKENKKMMKEKLAVIESIQLIERQIADLIKRRTKIPYKIPLSQMPESTRYNQLNRESKMLQNIIKMICYRAETALANLLSPHFNRANQEIRALIKSVILSRSNMEVDNKNQVLTITLFPLSNQRSNEAVGNICEQINATNTVYPGTNLRLFFKITTIRFDPSQES
jgi:hypothetical protein